MRSLGLLLIRLVIGGIVAVHGYAKVFGGPGKGKLVSPDAERLLGKAFSESMEHGGLTTTAATMENLGITPSTAAALALMATELGGGLALMLGWRTRQMGVAVAFSQIVAIRKIHLDAGLTGGAEGEKGWELNATLAAASAALALTGPGALSID